MELKLSLNNFYTKLWGLKSSTVDKITELGNKLQIAVPVITLYLGMIADDFTYIKVFACAFGVAIFISMFAKALFNNDRPRETIGTSNPDLNLDWSIKEGNSFSSGHTVAACTGGVFWFWFDPYLGCIGMLLGLITGFSRIVAKAHWLRDVLAAVFVSVVIYLVSYYYFLV